MYLPLIESKMKNPEQFGMVMNYGFATMTVLKIVCGVVGYLTFGQATSDVVTVNFTTGLWSTASNAVVLLITVSSYSLPMFAIFQIIEMNSSLLKRLNNSKKSQSTSASIVRELIRFGARLTCLLVTLFIAVSLPHFALFSSFIGFFTASLLSNLFPCLFYLILKYDKLNKRQIIMHIILVIMSICIMVIGLYLSLTDIIDAFAQDMGLLDI